MKVIVTSLLLLTSTFLGACKTCYYYEQIAGVEEQDSFCPSCKVSGCDASQEHCGAGKPTWDDLEYYYDEAI